MAESRPTLYSFRRCPYAMRARLALAVTGQTVEHREVVLRERPAELYAASAKGTVPVLVLGDGTVIDESLEIMLWTLQRQNPEGWLLESTALKASLEWIARCDGEFKQHLDRYKYTDRYPGAVREQQREAACVFLMDLEQRLLATAHLFGARPSLADMAIAPFVRQFASTDREWFDQQPWPQLRRWLEAFVSSALFAGVMHKHEPWKPESAPLIVDWHQ